VKEQEVRLTVSQSIRYATVQRGLDGGLTNAEAARTRAASRRTRPRRPFRRRWSLWPRAATPAAKRAHGVCPKGTPPPHSHAEPHRARWPRLWPPPSGGTTEIDPLQDCRPWSISRPITGFVHGPRLSHPATVSQIPCRARRCFGRGRPAGSPLRAGRDAAATELDRLKAELRTSGVHIREWGGHGGLSLLPLRPATPRTGGHARRSGRFPRRGTEGDQGMVTWRETVESLPTVRTPSRVRMRPESWSPTSMV